MIKCDQCNGGRKPHGFYSAVCTTCYGKGKLSVDDVWALRQTLAESMNDFRRLRWQNKMLNNQHPA